MLRARHTTAALLATTTLLLAGCSHLVAQQLGGRGSRLDAGGGLRNFFVEVFQHPGLKAERVTARDGTVVAYLRLSPKAPPPALECVRLSQREFTIDRAKASLPEPAPKMPRGTALLLHGYGGFKESMMVLGVALARQGYGVILPDARGHGESGGAATFGVRDARDLAELLDHEEAQGHLQQPLTVIGMSMGSVSATRLAAADRRVQSLVLLAPQPPFPQAVAAVAPLVEPALGWLVGSDALAAGARLAALKLGVADADDLSAEWGQRRLGRPLPVLLVHGDVDGVSPPEFSQRLAALGDPPADRVQLPARGHRHMLCHDEELLSPLLTWLARQSATPSTSTAHVDGAP